MCIIIICFFIMYNESVLSAAQSLAIKLVHWLMMANAARLFIVYSVQLFTYH